jgi:serine/threonine-protein kinase
VQIDPACKFDTPKRGDVSVAEALRMLREIAAAVAAAHAKGIVHRDLKPENVIVADDGSLHVVDFGLAKSIERIDSSAGADVTTTAGDVLGTPGYMAPEQIAGEPADVRADLFAIGVIGYELVTGERPFRGRTALEVAAATTRDEPAPLRASRAGSDLARVLMRCLEKWRADRFADARELVAALSGLSRTRSAGRRAVLLAAAAAASAIGLVVALRGMRPAGDHVQPTPTNVVTLGATSAPPPASEPRAEPAATSPAGALSSTTGFTAKKAARGGATVRVPPAGSPASAPPSRDDPPRAAASGAAPPASAKPTASSSPLEDQK